LPWIEFEDDIPSDLPVVAAQTRAVRKEHRTLLVDLLSLWAFQRVTRRERQRRTVPNLLARLKRRR
jgi:hypothetical protein